jgi:sodium transport system ATP-binding protein
MIICEHLSKSFAKKGSPKKERVQAISNVSFIAEDGKINGLLGPNGAGKSTTLRILSSLINSDSGSAIIDGFDIQKDPTKANQHIGFLPHNAGIYPRLSARENIRYFAELCGMKIPQLHSRIDELVEQLDMQDFIDRRAEGFSQGQRTKVALARALVHRPQTLILDEPANGLDVMATRKLRRVLRNLRDQGHCILFSSHVMQEIAELCDHIAIISDGQIAIADSPKSILHHTEQQDLEDAFVVAIGEKLEDAA